MLKNKVKRSIIWGWKQKLWSCGRARGSRLEGHGFYPNPMLDGSGVKAKPGSISAPNSGSLQKIRKIQEAKWGTPKLFFEKKIIWGWKQKIEQH